MATITTNTIKDVYLRKAPSVSADIVRELAKGSKLVVLGRNASGKRLHVRTGSHVGWVPLSYTTLLTADGLPVTDGEDKPFEPVVIRKPTRERTVEKTEETEERNWTPWIIGGLLVLLLVALLIGAILLLNRDAAGDGTGDGGAGTGEIVQEDYTYTPGGQNYAWPSEGAIEEVGSDGWTRIRQAANGEYLPWTFNTRITAPQSLDQVAQWDSATKLLLTNQTSSQTINVRVELRRDNNAASECNCDPYAQAFGSNRLGGGWFFTGSNASVVVNGSEPVALRGLGVQQLNFPRDWNGVYVLDISIAPMGQVTINQGERRTSTDNFPLP